jgi:hypothetical protein
MRTIVPAVLCAITLVCATAGSAQDHQHEPAAPAPQAPSGGDQHDHAAMPAAALTLFPAREASGTAWLPERTPMYAVHGRAGAWELMGHGNVFAQFLYEAAAEHRGSAQAGSINWAMGMARRHMGGGRFGVRTMVSLEPATIGGCGYPDLLATGELCDGDTIHDRQHPHDLFMELAAEYERPLAGSLRWQIYGGVAGEPALGPVAFPHRLSAMPNPLAPTSHHWFDATHITFGVVTAGVFSPRWKAEMSVFNGREPDENRWNLDFAPLDSISGRFSFAPSPMLVLQVSAGHLNEAEDGHGVDPRVDVQRVTASATYHHQLRAASLWATTLGWGLNEEGGEATQAMLLESSLTLDDRHVWYGRAEVGGKAAHDLHVHESTDVFTVGKLQGGYTRYLSPRHGFSAGLGGEVSAAIVPQYLAPRYGNRVNLGVGFFVTLRPGAHRMGE